MLELRVRYILLGFLVAVGTVQSTSQWINSTGIPSWLECLSVFPRQSGDAYLLAGTPNDGLYISKDAGATWVPVSATIGGPSQNGNIFAICVEPRKDAIANLYVIALSEGIFRTSDLGNTWEERDAGLPLNAWGLKAWYDLILVDTTLFVGTGANGVYRSNNGGSDWTFVGLSGGEVPKLFAYSTQGGGKYLFAFEYNSNTVFRSTDQGATWESAHSGLPLYAVVKDFAIIPSATGGMDLFAATVQGLYKSSDNGTTWKNATGSLPGVSVTALLAYEEPGGDYALLAGTYGEGIFLSDDSGNKWRAFNVGLQYSAVDALAEYGGYLFAATGGSVWRRPVADVTAVDGPTVAPLGKFSLLQNYPNPLNPNTTIRYELPMASELRLSVYDLMGREVSVLVNGRRNPGVHEVKFDGSNLASGVYFYRLQAGTYVETKKLLLIR